MSQLLTATVTSLDSVQLQTGQTLVIAQLSVSYLETLHFQRLLTAGLPPIAKRRKNRGPPPPTRTLKIWARLPSGERALLPASIGMSSPLDAPAALTVPLEAASQLLVGGEIEMEITEEVSPPPST